MKLIDFNSKHKVKLNTWQDVETSHGEKGINDFVVAQGTLLGDYIEYFSNEIKLISKVAMDNVEIVGFVCYFVPLSKPLTFLGYTIILFKSPKVSSATKSVFSILLSFSQALIP